MPSVLICAFMGTVKPKPWPKPKLGILRNVELFDAGSEDTHKGENYTDEDLTNIVNNFKQFSGDGPGPRVNPPCVIGHEEDQDWLRNTGLPAAGWPTNLRKVGRKLVGDLTDLPPDIADAIAKGHYRYVSAEIYDTPPAGVPAKGKMLRRVAFLGGELPHLKTLKRLPHPEQKFSEYDIEARSVNLRLVKYDRQSDGTFLAFSEVAMDRDQIIQMLTAKGMDKAVLDGMDDSQLQAVAKVAGSNEPEAAMAGKDKSVAFSDFVATCKKYADAYKTVFGEDMPMEIHDDDAAPEETPAEAPPADDDEGVDESELSEDEMPAEADEELADDEMGDGEEQGADGESAEEQARDDEESTEQFGEGNNNAPSVATEVPKKTKKKTVSTFSEDQVFSKGELKSMIREIVSEAIGSATAPLVKKFSEQEGNDVDNFLSQYSRKIKPSELDETGKSMTLRDILINMDNSKVVKFSEGGKEIAMTPRKKLMRDIKNRPDYFGSELVRVENGNGEVRHFSEKDMDVEKVRRFSESAEGRDKLRVTQMDPKEFVQIYEAADAQARAELIAGYGIQ